jgi:hypothetical protein
VMDDCRVLKWSSAHTLRTITVLCTSVSSVIQFPYSKTLTSVVIECVLVLFVNSQSSTMHCSYLFSHTVSFTTSPTAILVVTLLDADQHI